MNVDFKIGNTFFTALNGRTVLNMNLINQSHYLYNVRTKKNFMRPIISSLVQEKLLNHLRKMNDPNFPHG